jgi:hypothetical protein
MPSHRVKNLGAYQYAADTRYFVEVGRRSLANSTWFIGGVVENIKVVMIDVVPKEDIGNEFQEGRLSDASLSNKKDRVWRLFLVL